MKEEVESLIKKAEQAQFADEALRFSQAACNVANAWRVVTETAQLPKP